MRAYSTVQQLLCHGSYCELILSLARTSCRLLFTARSAARPLAGNPLRSAVRSRNPSKSTLAHDAVATAVFHKHHPIIRVGAGLIQFVYRSHLHLATEATRDRNAFLPFFTRDNIPLICTGAGPIHPVHSQPMSLATEAMPETRLISAISPPFTGTHAHTIYKYWPFANSHLGKGGKNTSWTRGKSALFSNDFVIGGLYPLSSNLLCVGMVLETEKKSALFSSNFLIREAFQLASNCL